MRRLAAVAALAALAAGSAVPAQAHARAARPAHPSKRYCKKRAHRLTRAQRRWCKRYRRGPGQTQPAAAPTGPLSQPPALDPSLVPPAGTSTTTTPAARLAVSAREYSLTLSRQQIASGAAIVELQNDGEDPHNLRIEPLDGGSAAVDFAQTGPGQLTKQRLTLAAGSYKLLCTLGTHDALGMHATLTVGP